MLIIFWNEIKASPHLVGRAVKHPEPTSCKQTDHEIDIQSSLMKGTVFCLYTHYICGSEVISVYT